MSYADTPARLTGLKKRRAWDSNPQPVSRHDISSVAASHSLTLRNRQAKNRYRVRIPESTVSPAGRERSHSFAAEIRDGC
jgi:hypothetical protein